ncbi:LysE family translocator [Tengunoibacter tsumagoiensis]|uniref:Lysine transporter LysE n=1 Tax=Tengunoibacter tsumagoiensis TaxID=2014871 RepID=A0A402A9I9_9CHLR|nr:LysE family transporter [Tengunoibacter tsumagoiensis]GCE15758.1 lysine transporter LysE [Tengunoibacter tsumagoiensis]
MEIGFLVRGLLIGLSVAAVVGPMSILCIQRTLHKGFRYGLVSGLGIATADGLYGCIAGFGLTMIASFLVHQQIWIRIIGGLFLIYLGGKTLFIRPADHAATTTRASSWINAYLSTFLLTLTNPLTILSFAAIFAGLGVGSGKSTAVTALLVVAGVFLGSTLWWLLLTLCIHLVRGRFTPQWMLWINRISGLIISLFGVIALIGLNR